MTSPTTECFNDGEKRASCSSIIYELELSLLNASTRCSIEKINALVADDFYEFGSSGKIWHKPDLLKLLPLEDQVITTINDFNAVSLSSNVIIATYRLVRAGNASLRSSIWRSENGNWQIIFHQGTPVSEI